MDPKFEKQLISRGKFLQYRIFEAKTGSVANMIPETKLQVQKGEIVPVDPQKTTCSLCSAEGAIVLTCTKNKLFLANIDTITLTVAQKAIIRQSAAILVGGNKTAVDYVSGLTSAGVIPIFPPYQSLTAPPVFNLCITRESEIIYNWNIPG